MLVLYLKYLLVKSHFLPIIIIWSTHRRKTKEQNEPHSFFINLTSSIMSNGTVNVSTELEMTSDARQNGRKARYVKDCKCR